MTIEHDDGGTGLGENAVVDLANEIAEAEGFPGGKGELEKFQRPGAIIAGGQRQYMSVLQQMIHAALADEEFRQELKRANWMSIEEADEWCAAYQECKRYGAPVDWLVNRLVAHSAGVTGGDSLLKMVMDTISHTTFTTNYQSQNKKHFWNRGNNKNGPISE